MVPIEAACWHEEQVDELFASLLGRSFPPIKDDDEDKIADGMDVATGGQVDVGTLRIFG